MKYNLLVVAFLLSIFLSSCNDDEYQSPGEIAAAQFSKMVKQKYVDKVTIQQWSGDYYYVVASEVEFTVDGAFLVIESDYYYNFEKLQFFTYDGGQRATLYFR